MQRRSLLESLENRQLLAGPDLIGVQPNQESLLFETPVRGTDPSSQLDVLNVAPRELLFRFDDNTDLDPDTLSAIRITRAGEDRVFESASATWDMGTGGSVLMEFRAAQEGTSGNGITLTFTASARATAAPGITVDGRNVSIDVSNHPQRPTRVQGLISAIESNPAARSLVEAIQVSGASQSVIGTSVPSGTVLTLQGANAAEAVTDFGTGGQVRVRMVSQIPGVEGRETRIEFEQRNFGGPANPVVVVTGQRVRVQLNRSPGNETTAGQLISAINSNPDASAIISASLEQGSASTLIGNRPTTYSPLRLAGVTDIQVRPGFVGLGDSAREVVFRFAEPLPDDLYQIDILGTGPVALANINGEAFRDGENLSRRFRIDLAPRVLAVVPEPVRRDPDGSLRPAAGVVEVYFNNDELDASLATDPRFYPLIFTRDTVSNGDDHVVLPVSVEYNRLANLVTLDYGRPLSRIIDPATGDFLRGAARLRIGSGEALPSAPTEIDLTIGPEPGDSFATAFDLNPQWSVSGNETRSARLVSEIVNTTPFPLDLPGPNLPGTRTIRPEDPSRLLRTVPLDYLRNAADSVDGITTIQYNFRASWLGDDPTRPGIAEDKTYFNLISEQQKERVREALHLFSESLGVNFVEVEGAPTSQAFISIAVGDLYGGDERATSGPGGLAVVTRDTNRSGIPDLAVLDFQDFDASTGGEFGDVFFRGAMFAVGQLLGFGFADDLPQPVSQSTAFIFDPGDDTEPSFPSVADIVHGRHLFRPDSTDIDLYRFTLDSPGTLTLETFAERLPTASLLDTALRLYRADADGNFQEIAFNDDYFSRDSLVRMEVEAGTYVVGVSAKGNTNYDPTIPGTGFGGRSQGEYELRIDFRPDAVPSLRDITGNALDGNGDGRPGGVFDFWFVPSDPTNTLYVDKVASGGPGPLGSPLNPFREIDRAIAAARPGDTIRIVGNGGDDGRLETKGDNLAYHIGFAANGTPLEDGTSLDLPRGVRMVIDPGAILKFSRSRLGVGSVSPLIDASDSALQVLGAPVLVGSSGLPMRDAEGQLIPGSVIFTSVNDNSVGAGNALPGTSQPRPGDWGGIDFRGDLDFADEQRRNREQEGVFLNHIQFADMRYGGGAVSIAGRQVVVSPIDMAVTRPTIINSRISRSADGAIAATPDTFAETRFTAPEFQGESPFTPDFARVGPHIYGNTVIDNSINGLFIRISTRTGDRLERVTTTARFDDTDIPHVLSENLIIAGNPGGPVLISSAPSSLLIRPEATTGGDVPAGTYVYRLTNVGPGGVESVASQPTIPVTLAATGAIRLNQLPTVAADSGFTSRRLYRATVDPVSGQPGDFRMVAQLNASSTSFVDRAGVGTTLLVPGTSTLQSRLDGGLMIDPGVVLKLDGARIETRFGANLIAEGTADEPVVFTSIDDRRYGGSGTFDTNGRSSTDRLSPGDWGGIYVGPGGSASLDHAVIAGAGGTTRVEGGFASFNPIEVHQGQLRLANSRLEDNADGRGVAGGTRVGRGDNAAGTLFVRAATPIVANNEFFDGQGPAITVDVNSLSAVEVSDHGRSSGPLDRVTAIGNVGPLVQGNVLDNNSINGMHVRGGTLTTAGVWDDVDIVHVVDDTIEVPNQHIFGGLRLRSDARGSLVVKFEDGDRPAGIVVGGSLLSAADEFRDIPGRIGGSLQLVGHPDFPVVLTTLQDDSAGAGFTRDGRPQLDTNNDGLIFERPSTGQRVLPTGPEVNRGNTIDNDVDVNLPGYFEATIGPGNEVLQSGVTVQDLSTGNILVNQDFIFQYSTFLVVDGVGTPLAGTEITQPPTLVADDVVESRGTFDGPNGPIEWVAISSFEDGVATLFSSLVLASPTGAALGDIRVVSYLDEDVFAINDDILVTAGTPGEADFRAFTLDGELRVGFSHGGFYSDDGVNQQNATFAGWTADAFPALLGAVTGGTANFSIPGEINLAALPAAPDADFGTRWGPADVTTAFAWDVVPTASSARVTSFLELLAADPALVSPVNQIESGLWKGVTVREGASDRNVALVMENEPIRTSVVDSNSIPSRSQFLGELAPNEQSGDENRRLGFIVDGTIATRDDVDVYSFVAESGTQVWLDIDRTSQGLDTIVELINANGEVLALSNRSLLARTPGVPEPFTNTALGMDEGAAQPLSLLADGPAGDPFSTNPMDAGMRVVLPGEAGTRNLYHVRVRSSNVPDPRAADALDQLLDSSRVRSGLTSGRYELQIRLREQDEVPGTQLNLSEIRYARDGLQIIGQPLRSPLMGEDSEKLGPNDSLANAQPLNIFGVAADEAGPAGGPLQSDQLAKSISGRIDGPDDVDWYRFDIRYDNLTRDDADLFLSTVFDLDYADNFARSDMAMYVFDAEGRLVLIGGNSNIADDQPGRPDSNDTTDLSRGSAGTNDPFIGPSELSEGTYYLAISNRTRVPLPMDQFFNAGTSNPLLRLEPIDSVRRIAEDRIGSSGGGTASAPVVPLLFDNDSFVEHTLDDVMLYVNTTSSLVLVNPFTGNVYGNVGNFGDEIRDIAFRANGELFAYTGFFNRPIADDAWSYRRIDTGTGQLSGPLSVGAGIDTFHWSGDVNADGVPENRLDSDDGLRVEAITIREFAGQETGFFVANRPVQRQGVTRTANLLYAFDDETGLATGPTFDPTGGGLPDMGAATSRREIGQIDTTPSGLARQLGIGPASAINAAGVLAPRLSDGDTFTVTAGGTVVTFELNAGFTFTAGANPAVADGDAVEIDGVVFEFDRDGVLQNAGAVAVPLPASVTGEGLIGRLAAAVRSQGIAAADAGLSLTLPSSGDASVLVGDALTLSGDPGVEGGNLPILLLPDDSAAVLAARVADAINSAPSIPSVTASVAETDGRHSVSISSDTIPDVQITDTTGGFVAGGRSPGGTVTGAELVDTSGNGFNDALFAVTNSGGLYRISAGELSGTGNRPIGQYVTTATDLIGLNFTGLRAGPLDIVDGQLSQILFGTTASGEIYAFNTAGELQPVFFGGRTSISTGISGMVGLDFASVNSNLWHVTDTRGDDPGHGIDPIFNGTRAPVRGGNSLAFNYEAAAFANRFPSLAEQPVALDGAGNLLNPRQDGTSLERTYNIPGGAKGVIQSNLFSLEGYSSGDQPMLYFNYFLNAEPEPAGAQPDDARDSLRVYVVTPDGAEHLVASNSTSRGPGLFDDEFDDPPRSGVYNDDINVEVQQLFNNTGTWRQARVSLGEFAGMPNLGLRIEFATAGTTDTGSASLRTVAADRLVHGQTLSIGGETFAIDLLPAIAVPSGAQLAAAYDDPSAVAVITVDGQDYVLDDGMRTLSPDQIGVDLTTLIGSGTLSRLTASQIASVVADTVAANPPAAVIVSGLDFSDASDDPAVTQGRNDLIFQATRLPYAGGNAELQGTGRIGGEDAMGNPTREDDVDLLRVDVVAGTTVRVAASLDADPDESPVIRFFDSAGDAVTATIDAVTGEARYTATADGAVFIGLSGEGNDAYDPRRPGTAMAGLTGEYSATITITAPTTASARAGLVEFDAVGGIAASPGDLFRVDGQDAVAGVSVRVSRDLDAAAVAVRLQRALADRFARGMTGTYPVAGPTIRLAGLSLDDTGPFTDAGTRWGDRFGDGAITGTRNNNFEGVYLDDFIIGFAERGEIATGSNIVSSPFVVDQRPQFSVPALPTSNLLTGSYQVEIRDASEYVNSLAGSPFRTFDTNDRLSDSLRVVARSGDEISDGSTFTLSDGQRTLTFEFDQVELGNGVTAGHVPVPFSLAHIDPITGQPRPSTAAEVAAAIIDAVNRPDVGPLLGASALPSSGIDGVADPMVNLFGPIVVDNVDDALAAVERSNRRGDANRDRSAQGVIMVENSRFLNNTGHGVILAHGLTATVDGVETASAVRYPRNLVTLNTENLKPGVVVRSNIMAYNGAGGLRIEGIDPDANETARDPVAYDRIVNNTIVGGTIRPGVGSPAQMFEGILFEGGVISFADAVVDYNPNAGGNPPAFAHRIPENALGPPRAGGRGPEPVDPETSVSLGVGGTLTLQFVDNLLTGSGDSRPDLVVFEVGEVESVRVEISRDGVTFFDVGIVGGLTNAIDIDAAGFGPQDRFAFVRLTDLRQGSPGVASRGADIDAVGALSTVPVDRFTAGGRGIEVLGNAGPVLLNNVISNTEAAIEVESAGSLAVLGGNSFHRNTENVLGPIGLGQFPQVLTDSEVLFVSPADSVFVPAPGARIIDSSIDSLEDRPSLNALKSPLGLPPSPILAPMFDVNGQLRVDDPEVDSPAGLGERVFKDRGAADRGDLVGPRAVLLTPQAPDLGIDGGTVSVFGTPPRFFEVQLLDGIAPADVVPGTGINDRTVSSDSVLLLRNGEPLVEGVDYRFGYNPSTNVLRLTPIAGVWQTDATYVIRMVDSGDAIVAASDGVTYEDGTMFRVVDGQGTAHLFEYETGITLDLAPGLVIPGGANGIVIELFDGSVSRSFELDTDGSVFPGNIAIAVPEGATLGELAERIAEGIHSASGLALSATAFGERVQLLGGTPLSTASVNSGLISVAGQIGTSTGFGLRIPAEGNAPAPGAVVDGQTFTIRRGAAIVRTFEFDTDGNTTTPGAIPVAIGANAGLDEIADAIVRAVGGAGLGLIPEDAGFGRVFLGVDTNLSLDLGTTGLQQVGVAGQGPALPVVVGIDQTAAEVAATIRDAVQDAGLAGVEASAVDRRVFLSGTGGISGVGAVALAVIQDEVGNPLQSNRPDGRTELTIFLGSGFDFGDAPAPYRSLLVDDGPRHRIDPGFSLGPTVTPDADARLPDADDDDGVRALDEIRTGFTANFEIIINNQDGRTFFVDAWFDWNRDGVFGPNEVVRFGSPGTGRIPLQNGANIVAINVPRDAQPGETYARFRLSEDSNLGPLGLAGSGEVEDIRLVVTANPFQNPVSRYDVNDSGAVTPLDALQIINSLERSGQSTVFLDNPPLPPLPKFPDVNGDSRVTALDALLVINELSRRFGRGEGERVGEGEADGGYAAVGPGVTASRSTLRGDGVIAAVIADQDPTTGSELPAREESDVGQGETDGKLSVFDSAAVIEVESIVERLAVDAASSRETGGDTEAVDQLFASL